jgi:hypothetical protein
MRQIFRSPRNAFGLFRKYCSGQPPSHDPEDNIELSDLCDNQIDTSNTSQPLHSPNSFFPFPNESSFLLSEWYWNDGAQKSQESFNKLLGIVGSPDFRPEDVRHKKWAKIDALLAKNDFDADGDRHQVIHGCVTEEGDDLADSGWMDEDPGWQKTPVSISVPFHSRLKNPGPKEYLVGDLYHQSLVSVIREKLQNARDNRNFHYEPFELLWKPTEESVETRVHGELYTTPAFLEAHRTLQESPGEPGCDLPRVVVAMMFWSDSTHLTSFGNAKLWPSYLYFGNESKYNRCKPTSHLCNHVAYFQAVGHQFLFSALRCGLTAIIATGCD